MTNKKSGRPTLYDKRMKRFNVMLDEESVKRALEMGSGNLSEGIRIALESNDAKEEDPYAVVSEEG